MAFMAFLVNAEMNLETFKNSTGFNLELYKQQNFGKT